MTAALLQPMADIDDLRDWAVGIMCRPPDFVIGDNYLRRWWVIPRNPFANVYLHHIVRSDIERALHDHPWASTSVLLHGGYTEHTPEGAFERRAGDVVTRAADALHRLEIVPVEKGGPGFAVSLFITGPIEREWGFQFPQGWVPSTEFLDPADPSKVGRGCGEG